uniref:Uncharacterized protein n=1 Tax=Amphimedon queenslandica TaxID=400682 RepID=A0A1X7SSB8_AMPQE
MSSIFRVREFGENEQDSFFRIIPSDLIKLMKRLLLWIHDRLSSGGCDEDYLFLISQTIMTAVFMRNDLINPELPLLAINAYPSSLPVLQCVLYYYKHINDERSPQLMDLLPLLKTNLTSPSGAIRTTTLQILNSCSFTPSDINEAEGQPVLSLLQFCLEAETVQSSLETYRNKLVCLSKLKYSSNLFSSLSNDIIEVPLRFLLGQLYINFTLIWDPVIDLISSYASSSEIIELFWSTFSEVLQYSSSKALDHENDNKVSPTSDTHGNLSCLNVHDVFESVAMEMKSSEWGRPDHWNYRRLLWRSMEKFPKVAERKSRVIVPLLLNFIDKEYGLSDDTFIKTQDISKTAPSTGEEEAEEEGEDESEKDELTVSKREPYPDRGKRVNKDGKKKIIDSHNGLN